MTERKYAYNAVLANSVKKFLDKEGWHYSFDENTGIYDFGLRTRNKIKRIDFKIDVQNDKIVTYGICPIGADYDDPEMMTQMAEFLCRANWGLQNGCFEFDFRDGEIRYRSFIDCDHLQPSNDVIENSVYCTSAMFRRYTPGILDIIFTGATAKDSIAKCEKSSADELHAMLAQASSEDADDGLLSDLLSSITSGQRISDEEDNGGEEEDVTDGIFSDLFESESTDAEDDEE